MTVMRLVPLRPRVPHGRVRTGAPKDADVAPFTSEFMGMAGYAPVSFHDLMDDEVESDGSSIGDVVALATLYLRSALWRMLRDSRRW